jgi:hypothetical protein
VPPDEAPPENPIEAIFEKAVTPFADGAALRLALPADATVVVMRKSDEAMAAERRLEGGATVRVPVLDAIKDAKRSGWHRVGDFDFSAMAPDEIGLLVLEGPDGAPQFRVITRARGSALLLADLSGMLDAVGALATSDLMKSFPFGDMLVEALRHGLAEAQADFVKELSAPDATGKSLLEQFKEHGRRPKGKKA